MLTDAPSMQFPFPQFIQIETTVICNAACDFCPHSKMTRRPFIMEESVWKKIIDESRERGVIYRPFLINEPFTDKRMPQIVRYIKLDKSARVEFNSNGELLKEELAAQLLDAGVDVIRFSIDGLSKEVFEKARPGVDRDRTYERVTRFLRLARDAESPIEIHIRMIDMPMNRHEQKDYVQFWKDQGAEHVDIVPLYTWAWNGVEKPVLKPCLKMLREMFFYVSGEATLCCWDYDSRGIIGDVKTQSVEEIWAGATNQRYRSLLAGGRRDQITLCSKCDAYKDVDVEKGLREISTLYWKNQRVSHAMEMAVS